jgi:hypothetical protein
LHGDVDQCPDNDLSGLDASLKWAGDDGSDRHPSQAPCQIRDLGAPDIVKADPLGPARQCPVGVEGSESMTDQQAGRHERHCTTGPCMTPETVIT